MLLRLYKNIATTIISNIVVFEVWKPILYSRVFLINAIDDILI